MKKQAGLKLQDNKATLYNTVVYERTGDVIRLNHGGWVTMSTAKAINTALTLYGGKGRISRRKGVMFLDNEPFVNNTLVFVVADDQSVGA